MADRENKQPASLKVLVNKKALGKWNWQLLFQTTAATSKTKTDWKYAQLNVRIRELNMPEWRDTFFAFISSRGESYDSDIALDDIQIRPDICQGFG